VRHRLSLLAVLLLATLSWASPATAAGGDRPEEGPAPAAVDDGAEANLTGLRQVQAGYNLSCGLLVTGQVRCWGENDEGELGNGNFTVHARAVPVRAVSGPGNLTGVTQIAVGDDHACALLTSGQVRCWGDNENGELGNGDAPTDRNRPVAVRNAADTANLGGVTAISAESDGVCARLSTAQVRCWGDDDYGQLGDGGGEVGSDLPVTVQNIAGTGPLLGVRSIEMGYDNNCAVLNNGQARCWGYNGDGQLGNDSTTDTVLPVAVRAVSGPGNLTNVTQITTGGYETCAVLTSRQVRCWGYNGDGALGNGDLVSQDRPVPVLARTGTGNLQNVAEVTGGYYHVCARLTTGQVLCWGTNENGEVGDGSTLPGPDRPRARLVKAPTGAVNLTGVVQIHSNQAHTCALLATGQARCWGMNDDRQLGNGATVDKSRPVPVTV